MNRHKRYPPEVRTTLEALQAFTGERTATRAIGIAMHQYPDTRTALLNTIAPGRRYGSSWMRWTR